MNRLTIGSIVTATLLLVGCGSDGNSSKSSLTDSSTPTESGVENPIVAQKIGKGYYVDSAVEGVTYQCGNESGVTDENGTFTFESGSDCTFTIGGVSLRDINASLLEDNITILETNTTVAQLLQTLDIDGDASNGIQISKSSDSVVKETIASVDDLNQDLLEAVHARLKAEYSSEYNGTVVDKNQTVAHLNATKADLKDRNIKTHLDIEAEHKGSTENNGSVSTNIDTPMGNMSGSHTENGTKDSNNDASAHVDTDGTMGDVTGNHSIQANMNANDDASASTSAHVDTDSTMGDMTGNHSIKADMNANDNASAHVDTDGTMGDMTGGHSIKANIDSNDDASASAHVDTDGTMGDMTGSHSIKANIDSNDDASASAHVDTNGTIDSINTMGSMTASHDAETNTDSSSNASTHIDGSMDSNSGENDSSSTQEVHSSNSADLLVDTAHSSNSSNTTGSASARTETHSNSSSSSSESSSSSSVTGAMGGFGRR